MPGMPARFRLQSTSTSETRFQAPPRAAPDRASPPDPARTSRRILPRFARAVPAAPAPRATRRDRGVRGAPRARRARRDRRPRPAPPCHRRILRGPAAPDRRRSRRGPTVNTNAANSSSTVARSSSRSSTIVANADDGFICSRLASKYGRITSPARAGRRKLAANPITVVVNALPNRVGPMGARRNCQRQARTAYVSPVATSPRISNPASARRVSAQTPRQIGLPECKSE